MTQAIIVSTFYHFAPLHDLPALKSSLLERMIQQKVKGTITLAAEGINATICGSKQAVDKLLLAIRNIPGLESLQDQISHYKAMPFGKSKVKIKPELISLGEPTNPSVCVGAYVAPKDWNALITRKDVITIDTRNYYEYKMGHFKNALNPDTRNFKQMVAYTREQLNPKTHPHIAMYCTGGIRCEKYSSYLLDQGFKNIYHLKEGILAYLTQINEVDSLWQGDCYVFDDRIAISHGLRANPDISKCLACGLPLYSADRAHADYIENAQCASCASLGSAKNSRKRKINITHG
jgi:UPF0176 protein